MSLERKIKRTPWQKVTSWLTAATLVATSAVPWLGGSCASTLGTSYERSWIPPQQVVVSSTELHYDKIEHRLGEQATVHYDSSPHIEVPLQEIITRSRVRRDTIEDSVIYDEIEHESETFDVDMYCRSKVGGAISGACVGGGVLGLLVGATIFANNVTKGEWDVYDGLVLGTGFLGAGIMALISSLFVCKWKILDSDGYSGVPTGQTTTRRENRRTEETQLSLQTFPPRVAQSGSVTVSGDLFPQRTYPVSNGTAVVNVSHLEYPLIFAGNREAVKSRVDISWINPQCQGGVLDYIAQQAEEITPPLRVRTHSPAGAENYQTDERTYQVKLFKGPSRENIIRFVVDKNINSHIRQGTITYLAEPTHYPINDVRITLTPASVPQPADLSSECFGQEADREIAQHSIRDYLHSRHVTEVDGSHSFSVYTPSVLRASTAHPQYKPSEQAVPFTADELSAVILLAPLVR